jgi:hypothetical protein
MLFSNDFPSRLIAMTPPLPKMCSSCAKGLLHADTRDVTVRRGAYSETVPGVVGLFFDGCEEIEFEASTDSAQRYVQAGDRLVQLNRSELEAFQDTKSD